MLLYTKKDLHKRVCENEYFYNVNMISEDTKILEFNQNQKFDMALFIISVDLESLTERFMDVKIILSEVIPSGFSMSTISSFRRYNVFI